MKISFKQSGGITGAMKACELDTDKMSAPDKEELTKLINASSIFAEDSAIPRSAADSYQYDLELEDHLGKRKATASDLSLDNNSRQLIQFLKSKAVFIRQ